MSKIRWHLISWNPTRTFPFMASSGVKPYLYWNEYHAFNIYFSIDIIQKSVPIYFYICSTSSTVFETLMTNLWEVFQYFLATLPMMWSRLFAILLTQQCKAGLCSIWLLITHSDNSIGFEGLRYFSVTQDFYPSFHYTWSCHPAVVFLGILLPFIELMNRSLIEISLPSDLWSVILLNSCKWRL